MRGHVENNNIVSNLQYCLWFQICGTPCIIKILSRALPQMPCLFTDWTTGVRSPAETNDSSSSLCVQTSSEAQPASYPTSMRGRVLSPGVKGGPGVTPACDAEVIMSRSYISPLPLVLVWRSGTALLFTLPRQTKRDEKTDTTLCHITSARILNIGVKEFERKISRYFLVLSDSLVILGTHTGRHCCCTCWPAQLPWHCSPTRPQRWANFHVLLRLEEELMVHFYLVTLIYHNLTTAVIVVFKESRKHIRN
jgi:hypothetical protein